MATRKVKAPVEPEEQEELVRGKDFPMSKAERENRLIDLAYNLAEQRLKDGSASNQLVAQIIKSGMAKGEMEKALLDKQIKLTDAKYEAMVNPSSEEQRYLEALEAFKDYSGSIKRNEVVQ